MPNATHYTVVVIGTGFGGTMTALPIARAIVARNKGENILMLERGTWWTTPVGTVQDKEVKTYDFLVQKGQPVQYWSTPNHFRGFIDIFTRCFRRKKNEDGLYDFSVLGRRGLLGFLDSSIPTSRFGLQISSSMIRAGPSPGPAPTATPSTSSRATPSERVCCGL